MLFFVILTTNKVVVLIHMEGKRRLGSRRNIFESKREIFDRGRQCHPYGAGMEDGQNYKYAAPMALKTEKLFTRRTEQI